MRILVISDVHANLTALQAVVREAGTVDETWCLGDLVGYGPDPNQVVEEVRKLPRLTCVLGNHDAALLRRMEFEAFNGEARRSLVWTDGVLTADNLGFLRSLPDRAQTRGAVTLVHGSPRDPTWEYVNDTLTARLNFSYFDTPFCFVGHTHIPGIFYLDEKEDRVAPSRTRIGERFSLTPRAIVNPGSVGQPRDRDPRAAYALYDGHQGTWEARRAEYDFAQVQQRIRDAGLPSRHALRLAEGW